LWAMAPPSSKVVDSHTSALSVCPGPQSGILQEGSAEISVPILSKEAADFCAPASDTLDLIFPNAPCTRLIPSGRALILSILYILSKKQRQDERDSQD
jgi:hypothetical protein